MQIFIQLFFAGPGGAINAAQNRIVAVAAPIGTGDLGQLEGEANILGGAHVRATAEVKPLALFVDFQILTSGNGVDQLDLELFALGGKNPLGLLARPHLFAERGATADNLDHFLFDGAQIILGKRLIAEKIIVKPVFNHRADGDLGSGP